MVAWLIALILPNFANNSWAMFITDFLGIPRPITRAKSSWAESASGPNLWSLSRGLSDLGRSRTVKEESLVINSFFLGAKLYWSFLLSNSKIWNFPLLSPAPGGEARGEWAWPMQMLEGNSQTEKCENLPILFFIPPASPSANHLAIWNSECWLLNYLFRGPFPLFPCPFGGAPLMLLSPFWSLF